MRKSASERFWGKVKRADATACWEWSAARTDFGYGQFWLRGTMQYAHRVAWELTHGDPGELRVLHSCDNPCCCNPAHLFLGTLADNTRDCIEKGRRNYARGERQGQAKLTASMVRALRAYRGRGMSLPALSRLFGVAVSTVDRVAKGLTWKHV